MRCTLLGYASYGLAERRGWGLNPPCDANSVRFALQRPAFDRRPLADRQATCLNGHDGARALPRTPSLHVGLKVAADLASQGSIYQLVARVCAVGFTATDGPRSVSR